MNRKTAYFGPVRVLETGRACSYSFDAVTLEPGDHVFVSGKLAGQLGVVEKVTTRFKISLSDYERVISKASGRHSKSLSS